MPTNEETMQLSAVINAVYPATITGQPTVQGWVNRLLAAGIAYGRGPETAERWEQLQEVRFQAETYFLRLEECPF